MLPVRSVRCLHECAGQTDHDGHGGDSSWSSSSKKVFIENMAAAASVREPWRLRGPDQVHVGGLGQIFLRKNVAGL